MIVRNRGSMVVLLGLLFWVLILHDLYSFRLRIILEQQSFSYVLNLLPGNSMLVIAAGLLAVLLFLGLVFLAVRRLFIEPAQQKRGRGYIVTCLLGTAMVLIGCLLLWSYPHDSLPQEWSGAAAATVGISLIFFTFLGSKRPLILAHLILLITAVVVGAMPQLIPAHREKTRVLRELMENAMNDLERQRREWELLDPIKVLDEANARAEQQLIYRFDEHLPDITQLRAPTRDLKDITKLRAPKIDFDEGILLDIPRDAKFVASGSTTPGFELSEGKQLFPNYRGGSLLRTEEPLSLDTSAIGSFLITLKVSAGSYFQVFWGQERDPDRRHGIRIPLGPPGKSASYEIKESIIRYRGKSKVNYIWIIPSDRDAKVEIESFQILDRISAALRGVPFGVGYENVDEEIRRVLFVPTPSEITYTVEVPLQNPRLLFGLSSSDETIPTTFEVTIGQGGKEQTIFSKVVSGEPRWYDHELDFTPWAGKRVDITLKTSAEVRTLGLWSNPVLLGAPSPEPNVVIFLVDCLRADHLGAYGYSKDTSPVFDSLSTRGTLFKRALSNGTTTKYSIPSLFSSNPISSTGVRNTADVLPDEFPTLAEIVRTMGYATAAFTMNGNAGPFSGTHQGFSRLFSWSRITREAGGDSTSLDAEILIGYLLENWIQQSADRNFFLYIHTMDAHGPYDPPEQFRHFFATVESVTPVDRNPKYDPPWISSPTRESRTALYDGEIAYGDVYLGRLIGMLDEAGVLENTIFIFTSDHGEYFGEHGMWGHNPPPFVQGTSIPLLIVGPGFPAGVRVGETVQILDILPTVLDALGMEPDSLLFQGKSLLPLALAHGKPPAIFSDRTVFIEGSRPGELAFHCGNFHLIPEKNIIFDLSRDPQERIYFNEFILDFGLKSLSRKVARSYLQTYADLHAIISPAGGGALDVDPKTLDQLRSLGYIE